MDDSTCWELEHKLKILSALDKEWGGGESTLRYDPHEDTGTPIPKADMGILRIAKATMGQDALLTLEVAIPKTGIAYNAASGQGDPIRQADKYFGYLRDLADKADVGLDDCSGKPIETEAADAGVAASKHEFHFHSSPEGLSFQGKIQMRVHAQDSEKLHTALKNALRDLQNQLAPLGEVPHDSVIAACAEGRVQVQKGKGI